MSAIGRKTGFHFWWWRSCSRDARHARPFFVPNSLLPRDLMPKRTDISTILIIGAGPIVIGQACEFDHSGTQAVKTLKEEGYRIGLANSNTATIMTNPDLTDTHSIDPIKPELRA